MKNARKKNNASRKNAINRNEEDGQKKKIGRLRIVEWIVEREENVDKTNGSTLERAWSTFAQAIS